VRESADQPPKGTAPPADVRELTQDVVYFITPDTKNNQGTAEDPKYIPPGLRFLWGSFIFEGVVDSISENLEFFSAEGRPLRSKISISLTKQEIQFKIRKEGVAPAPPQQAKAGETIPDLKGKSSGNPENWQDMAAANLPSPVSTSRPAVRRVPKNARPRRHPRSSSVDTLCIRRARASFPGAMHRDSAWRPTNGSRPRPAPHRCR
jgi:hypothetical protein